MSDIENPGLDQHDLELQELLAAYRKQRLFELLLGPIVSLVVHLVAIVAMVIFMVPKDTVIKDEVVVQMDEKKEIELDEPEPPEEIIEEEQADEDAPELDESIEEVPVEDVADVEEIEVAESVDTMEQNVSELRVFEGINSMDSMYKMRTSAGKMSMGRRYGGKYYEKTKQAVIATLEWMKLQQNEDGSWPKSQKGKDGTLDQHKFAGSMTSLGMLSFLANGVTPDDKDYGYTLEAAASWLRSQVDLETGKLKAGPHKVGHNAGVYQQAIATYAMCEFYGMTKIPTFKPVMDKMVEFLIKHQREDGSWSYSYDPSKYSDASVTGWHAQALKAAYSSGCEVEGLEEATQKVSELYLENVITDSGSKQYGYGYYKCAPKKKQRPKEAIGAVSGLCLQLYGEGRSLAVKAAFDRVKDEFVKSKNFIYENPKYPRFPAGFKVYDWYYQTQLVFQYKQMSLWRVWNSKFIYGQLYKNQIRSKDEASGKIVGYWKMPGSKEYMAKASETSWSTFYATALNCLTLQVYYRNLPTSKKMSFAKEDDGSTNSLFEESDDSDSLFD
jgi:hypothetical protein